MKNYCPLTFYLLFRKIYKRQASIKHPLQLSAHVKNRYKISAQGTSSDHSDHYSLIQLIWLNPDKNVITIPLSLRK